MKVPRALQRPKTLWGVVAVGVSLTGGLIAGCVLPAEAVTAPPSSDSSAATVVENGQTFVTSAGVNSSWQAVISTFPKALPAGVTWPQSAPAFFNPTGGGARDLYQPELFAAMASRFWRCAWLAKQLDGERANSLQAQSAAKTALAGYSALPGTNAIPLDQYLAAMKQGASGEGVSPEAYEFSVDCGIYTQEGYVR